jgi:hypothetical protein
MMMKMKDEGEGRGHPKQPFLEEEIPGIAIGKTRTRSNYCCSSD